MCFIKFVCLLLIYGSNALSFEDENDFFRRTSLSTTESWTIIENSVNSSQFSGDTAISEKFATFNWNSNEFCIYYEDPEYFLCEREGLFPNLNDPDCESYITCTQSKNGDFILRRYECPNDTYYNPHDQVCDYEYECPCWNKIIQYWISSDSDSESIDVETRGLSLGANLISSSEVIAEFECTQRGRFPNQQDTTCQTYFLCNLLRSGSFIKTKYNCPANSYFNAKKQLCDINYQCSVTTLQPTSEGYNTSVTSSITNIPTSTTERSTTTVNASTVISTTQTATTKSDFEPCIFNENPNYFQCTEKGRFPNFNDPSCRSYFLCNKLRSGVFVKTKYNCPTNSFFDLKQQLCRTDYQCPCSGKTTLQPATTITTLIPSTKEPEKCIYNDNPEYFQCTHKGRFPNHNDLTCESYYLCNLLRNGQFVKTKYKCPEHSFFDAAQQLCNVNYICPCTEVTTALPSSTAISSETTTSETTSLSTSVTNSTPSKSTTTNDNHPTTSIPTKLTTEMTTSTQNSDKCIYYEDPDYFQCAERGRFPNYNDLTCHTYFLCNLLRSGKFIKTKYSCPPNTYFDASQQLCSTKFRCPCENTTTTESPVSTTTGTVSPPITPDDKNNCTYFEDPDYFQCNQKGRFPNLNDLTCSSYFLCNRLRNGKFIKTKYQCPSNSFFNASEQLCSTHYKCPCDEVTIQPRVTTTTPGSKCIYEDDPKYFQCTQKGRFPNYNDLTCQSYYLCNRLRSGKFIQTQYQCPTSSYFDASQQLCDINYKCPCSYVTPNSTSEIITLTPTTLAPTTQEDQDVCQYEEDPEYFQCNQKGRFLNQNDLTCQSYYLCNLLRSGRFIKTKYNCPIDSFFNYRKQLCDKNYQCPCKNEDKRTAPMLMALHIAAPPDADEDQISTMPPETTSSANGLSAMLENLFLVLKFSIQGGDKEPESETLQLPNVLFNQE